MLNAYVRRSFYLGKYEFLVDVLATLSILPLIWSVMKFLLDDDLTGYSYFVMHTPRPTPLDLAASISD